MLEVKNLSVSIHGKPILDGLDLTAKAGEVAAIMGPNGSGKSTLSYVIAGKPDYEVTGGDVLLDGESLLSSSRTSARQGRVSRFPISGRDPRRRDDDVPQGRAQCATARAGEDDLTTPDFMRAVRGAAKSLEIDFEMLKRPVNVGFSGGEKKRAEVLQMALLAAAPGVLDETDSGLDIDALRIVAEGVNALRDPERAFIVITHYQRLLDYIKPDVVHVMAKGRIVKTGGPELALELERNGYRDYADAAA